MKLYRDMTAEERAEADLAHEDHLHWQKRDAEEEMEWWDEMSPEQRAYERWINDEEYANVA